MRRDGLTERGKEAMEECAAAHSRAQSTLTAFLAERRVVSVWFEICPLCVLPFPLPFHVNGSLPSPLAPHLPSHCLISNMSSESDEYLGFFLLFFVLNYEMSQKV